MTGALWFEHPLFSAETQQDMEARLEIFDDGLVLLSEAGEIVHLTSEAARQLEIDAETAKGKRLSDLVIAFQGWADLVAGVAAGQSGDYLLRRRGGHKIMAVPKMMHGATEKDAIRLIFLRDLSGLDYRRDRASGQETQVRAQFIAEIRTRPDFVTQRILSPELHRLLSRGERAMLQGARILITGESGVGKSEIAKFLHSYVSDADAPFVVANCASSSDELFARSLFGVDGSAEFGRAEGLIEQAEGGTLFLDEVAEIPLSAQALMLRFLDDGVVTGPAGGQYRVTNVRVIAATNRDLRALVRDGRFRADLYYRLAVVPLWVPPLRDMPPLVDHLISRFLRTINQRRKTPVLISRRLRDVLGDYSYPGNIRELLNIVQKLVIFLEETDDMEELIGDLLSPIDIPGANSGSVSTGPVSTIYNLKSEVRRYERTLIDRAIRIHGSKRKAANALGVDIGTIVRKTAEPITTEKITTEKMAKRNN